MTFWNISDLLMCFNKNRHIINIKRHIKSEKPPPKNVSNAIRVRYEDDAYKVRIFLQTYFGKPPDNPILNIPESELLNTSDFVLYVLSLIDHQVIGCIRYHYCGLFNPQNAAVPMFIIDCFCVHPQWRKKGIGEYLLLQLNILSHKLNIPQSLFLKEGPLVNTLFKIPKYSSNYVYSDLHSIIKDSENNKNKNKNIPINNVISLSTANAFKIMDIFTEFNPDLFIIRNSKTNNQHWRLYKKGNNKILLCFQDCYQYKDNNKMAMCTAFFSTPNIDHQSKNEAINELVMTLSDTFKYVWMNRSWFGNAIDDNQWKDDGPFHWYLYQWNTYMNMSDSYCIMI
jgi:hypothetical protein